MKLFSKNLVWILITLVLSNLAPVWGQSPTQKSKFNIGFQAGPSFSDIAFYELGNRLPYRPALGWTAGATIAFPLGRRISIQTGLNYHLIHNKWSLASSNPDSSLYPNGIPEPILIVSEALYHDFDLPLVFRYHVSSAKKGFYFAAGPDLSFCFKRTWINRVKIGSGETIQRLVYNSNTPWLYVNVLAMVGYHFPINDRTSINLEPFFRMSVANYNQYFQQVDFGMRVGLQLFK